jgi:hypothetical protein
MQDTPVRELLDIVTALPQREQFLSTFTPMVVSISTPPVLQRLEQQHMGQLAMETISTRVLPARSNLDCLKKTENGLIYKNEFWKLFDSKLYERKNCLGKFLFKINILNFTLKLKQSVKSVKSVKCIIHVFWVKIGSQI